jgi:serine/threonine-protein kinase
VTRATSIQDRLVMTIGDRYSIERKLDREGMGYIFIGREKLHGAKVAIKVLPPEGPAKGRRRFLREIKFASTMQHPYILPIKEWGQASDLLYYVMPFVANGSLKARIDRHGSLPIQQAVRLATEIAEGLDHAHRSGLIHRDLKPSNILMSGGLAGAEDDSGLEHEHAVIADFGLARSLATDESGDLTTEGIVVGTPAYMSPEQIEGQAEASSDIYSLGCVLFEMLTGRPPYCGSSKMAILTGHAAKPIPSLRGYRSDAPWEIEEIVTRALAKTPIERYPTARSMGAALSAFTRST